MGVDSQPDLFEAFNMGSTASMFPEHSLSAKDYPENIWPESPANFQPAVNDWFSHAGLVARKMTRVFEHALQLPPNYFVPFQDHSLDVLRINHYDISAEIAQQLSGPDGQLKLGKDQQGMGAHTDYGIVTVLWADAVQPGIQVMDASGHWHEAIPEPGALLINLGDLMARWTNNRWLSSMHRVPPPINPEGQPVRRRSAAYFHDGNADAVIECLSSCQSATHPPRYAPITVADHIRAKLAGSRTLQLNEKGVKDDERISNYLT
jgi:isopenicillin N synthase-like dioxygenase